jgi:hypothetical protein
MEENSDDWQKQRKGYLMVAVICFFIGLYLFLRVNSQSYDIENINLEKIENIIIAEKPIFKETKGKNGRKWLEFKCVNNKSNFEITSFDYSCSNDDEILNEVNIGDTISIKILKSEIEDFNTENNCEIHSLIKKEKEYLNIECRNKAENNDSENTYIILFAITFMTGLVFSFSEKPKFFDDVDPRVPIWIIIILLFIYIHKWK